MATIFISLFAKFWPIIIGVGGIAFGAIWGFIKTKGAVATEARAAQQVAEGMQQVAEAGQQIEQANADAARAETNAVENAAAANQQAQAATPADVDQQLDALGALRKE
ncbi:Uncharacterised protein [Burkholderia pseudomallei]|uniref:hypothetical protein n=1 Tax=Burkholderia pseudomallei TaxID=28450 RepID=UPI0005E95B0F|nr:hypothetical protein [Burkholderia pseudomallei]CAJ5436421.1 Uncharacterised protein [Burkholderia pseudomallei]CAK1305647.1 Uncharacterised protein [Burkholderia pseudomallei]